MAERRYAFCDVGRVFLAVVGEEEQAPEAAAKREKRRKAEDVFMMSLD